MLLYHLYTMFLFTKSDIKTTVIPITALAAASAPMTDISRLPHVIFWIWFHVLQFDVSNQTLDPHEDENNKKDRPLPAKRITWRNALILRWVLVPACWALSACYSLETFYASIALVALTVIYDELGAHSSHWLVRNLVNAAGFAAFETGATLIAGNDPHRLDGIGFMSICASAGIFATTIQAQDFKDTIGDKLIGRQTLPIVAPGLARPTLMLALSAWSVGLSILWHMDAFTTLAFNVLALAVGGRYMALKSIAADQKSFYLYNVWLSVAHVLPAYRRIYSSA